MELEIYNQLSVEEKILSHLKTEQRSTYWLANKTGLSQTTVYRMLMVSGIRKMEIKQTFIERLKELWPTADFSPPSQPLLPHEQLEADRIFIKNKPLFNDNNT